MKVGVLALQGAYAAHARVMRALGAEPAEIRTPAQLDDVDALVIPGGESTTMSMLLQTSGLFESIRERLEAETLPALGTCAGLILLAREVRDGRADQRSFGVLDLDARRNGFGRQVDSFETDLAVDGLEDPFHAVFIRAPVVERAGNEVDVLAAVDGKPVLVRQGAIMAAAFHPELSGDDRIHRLFLEGI